MTKHKRRFGSVARELVRKGREAMLSAVQIYNNPQVEFKSELFIVTIVIAWTYLLHAYYRRKKVEHRQFIEGVKRRKFLKTRFGAIRRWSLEQCLENPLCPLDEVTKKNLFFLIGIRHEIEHQMTSRIDDQLSAKFQATALNFNLTIKKLFGEKYSLDSEQAFSIQFSAIDESAAKNLMVQPDLPQNIRCFVAQFESQMTQEEFDDPRFSYRVAFVRKTTNSKTAADKVVQFVTPGSETATEMNRVFLKETEKNKYKPGTIVKLMKAEGFQKFGIKQHTDLWKSKEAKNPRHQHGVLVEGSWFWYEGWVAIVRQHCQENEAIYKPAVSATAPAQVSATVA